MTKQKKALPTLGTVLYGIGGLSAVTEVVFLLLFLPLFGSVNEIALPVGAFAGIVLPVFIMPLCYAFVNGNTAIATGRYHLIIAVTSLIASLGFVGLLGVDGKMGAALQGFAVFGLVFAYSLCIQIYLYASSAIGRRLNTGDAALKLRNVFALLSALAAALIIFWLIDSTRDSVRDIISISAIILVAGAFVTYASTVREMPSFLRIEPKHKRSIVESYSRFVRPVKTKPARFLILSAFLVCAGAGFAVATIPGCVFGNLYGISKGYKLAIVVGALTLAVSGTLCTFIIKKKGRRAGAVTFIAVGAVMLCVTVLAVIFTFVPVKIATDAFTLSYAGVCGLTLGAAFAYENDSKNYVSEISGSSHGLYYCFRNCVAALGLGVGVTLACVVRIVFNAGNANAAVTLVYAAYAVLIAAGAILNYLNLRREKKALTGNEESEKRSEAAEVR